MTVVADETTEPQFTHVLRGYDRLQVDQYVEQVLDWAQAAQARADYAEAKADELAELARALRQQLEDLDVDRRATSQQALTDAADRSAAALTAAFQESGEIRHRASQEAEGLLTDARQQALEIVASARRAVVGLGEACTQERRRTQTQVDAMMEEASIAVTTARREAAEAGARLLGESETEAKRLVWEAEKHAAAVVQQAAIEVRASEAALARLRSEEEQIVDELARLRAAIHTLLDDRQLDLITDPGPPTASY